MKTILIPVERHDDLSSTLATACLVGTMFDSYIEAFALRPALPPLIAMDPLSATVMHGPEWDGTRAAHEARSAFLSYMRERGVPPAHEGRGFSYNWLDDAPAGDGFVGAQGRVFDLTVVGRPGAKANGPRMSTLEAALFESGRPILIAPPRAPSGLGGSILIAWNGSEETARAIAFAMPFLHRARRVAVLEVQGGSVPGPGVEQVAQHLARNGIEAEVRSSRAGKQTPGEVILAEAAALQSDLLIKGAYTQSRLRQMIFGGATSHILAAAELPVLMAH